MEQNTGFADGWLCPLYKKNDKREPGNYRPVTVLNSDYKIFTKALSIKLCKLAPKLIHESQAGFVPGRSIINQVKLTKLMLDFAEADDDQNGAIVALDQEKAYDKIMHDYLWRALKAFNLPSQFINTIKALYSAPWSAVYRPLLRPPLPRGQKPL